MSRTDQIMRASSRVMLAELVRAAGHLRECIAKGEGMIEASHQVAECHAWLDDGAAAFDRKVEAFKELPDEPAELRGGSVLPK